jgi:hypothetical protein
MTETPKDRILEADFSKIEERMVAYRLTQPARRYGKSIIMQEALENYRARFPNIAEQWSLK